MTEPHPRGLLTFLQWKRGCMEQGWTKTLQHHPRTDEQRLGELELQDRGAVSPISVELAVGFHSAAPGSSELWVSSRGLDLMQFLS